MAPCSYSRRFVHGSSHPITNKIIGDVTILSNMTVARKGKNKNHQLSARTDGSRPTGKNKNHQKDGFNFWWPWSDSNRHSLQNLILSQARLPIPPRGQCDAVPNFKQRFLH